MKVALVTGISGFIGRNLAAALRFRGIHVVGIVRGTEQSSSNDEITIHGDITDRSFVVNIIQDHRPDVVFHLAANKSRIGGIEDFRQSLEDNLMGTLNLAEACIGKPYIQRFVAMGTCEEYGQSTVPFIEDMRESPVSAYSFSKTAATHLLQTLHRSHHLPVSVLRPSLAYGPGQMADMFLPALIQTLLKKKTFAMSGGQQTRDFVYIDDLIEAITLAATIPDAVGKVINIGSGVPVLLKNLALMVANKIGVGADELIEAGKKCYRPNEIMDYVASNRAAKDILGWWPRTAFDEGLNLTVEYYRRLLAEDRIS